jgi:glycine/D-amino acid oxidase-like deaminating enzyme
MADALVNSGLRVAAVDRRMPMTGSTPASTSLLLFELDTPLTVLRKKVGRGRGARAWLRSAAAVRDLGDRILDLSIRCDFRARSSLYLPGNVLGVRGLALEAQERGRLGLRSRFIRAGELRQLTGIRKPGAILSRGNAEADPVKLVAGLWERFRAAGGKIVPLFDAVDLDESKTRVCVHAGDGRQIIVNHAVICTGYELPKFVQPTGTLVKSTWVIATKPQRRNLWPGRELIWQAADPYFYIRTTPDGRVLAGGADEPFADAETRDRLIKRKSAKIAGMAKCIFPHIDFEPQYAWAGTFGDSETGMPAIGLVPGYKRTYAALGFGGNGITFSMLAAQIVSRAINGITDPDADIFRL